MSVSCETVLCGTGGPRYPGRCSHAAGSAEAQAVSVITEDLRAQRERGRTRAQLSLKPMGARAAAPALAAQGISQIDARACLQACGILLGNTLGTMTFSGNVGVCEPLLCGQAVRAAQ